MKKVLLIFLIVISSLFFTGCEKEEVKPKYNCFALDCIKEIDIGSTKEEVDKIVGKKGKLSSSEDKTYRYYLHDDGTITITVSDDKVTSVKSSYNKYDLMDKDVDLSKISKLEAKVNNGMNYKEFKKFVGGKKGILIEKSSSYKKYIWVSKKGGYVVGIFRNSDKRCIYFYGYGETKK